MMKQGAKGYIQKPFSAEELVSKVDETLDIV
jgi:FixJ family two-component response regulator